GKVIFSPDGKRLVWSHLYGINEMDNSRDFSHAYGVNQMWDTETGQHLIDLPWGGETKFLSDGRLLSTHGADTDSSRNRTVVISSPGETPEVRSFKIEPAFGNSRVQFSSDSRLTLLAGRALVDLPLGHETFDAPIKVVHVRDADMKTTIEA